jgi:spore germination protein KC
MRALSLLILMLVACMLLSGCLGMQELSERGFVQAVAIDQAPNGSIMMTTLIYKPGGSGKDAPNKQAASYIDIQTQNPSILGASSNIDIELGRRVQWSHMRVLLISEEVARRNDTSELLDFFIRHEESRTNIPLMITQGKASDFLKIEPYIENTMGQQLLEIGNTTSKYVGRSVNATLTDLFISSKEDNSTLALPLLTLKKNPKPTVTIIGLAIIEFPKGNLTDIIPYTNTPYAVMLMNKFKKGFINIPCAHDAGKPNQNPDSFEITQSSTRIKPIIKGENLSLLVHLTIEGSAGELVCTSLTTEEEISDYKNRINEVITTNLTDTIRLLQQKKADLIGLSDQLYRYHNKTWKRWKSDWPERFAECEFQIEVNIRLINTRTLTGKTN